MKTQQTKEHSFEGSATVLFHLVKFSYWDFTVELTPDLEVELSDHAEQHAHEMIIEGYHSGELCFCSGDDEEIRGWWEISK